MKMSDEQFNNNAQNGTGAETTDTSFTNEEMGVDFANPVATEAPATTETPAAPSQTNKKNNGNAKVDKKNLQPECHRKVFIGSLNYTTTEETMREHFGKYGDIVDCVIMKESKSGKSRGFGFVTYLNQGMVDELMKARPHKIDGRELETKRATPREEAGKPGAEISTKKLFVGAIKEGLTEEHLKEYFGKYGKIEDCIVMKDKESGKPRGFGFVSFDDYDPIDKIVLEKNHTVNNQAVAVKKAMPKDQTVSGRNQNNNGNNFNGNFNNNRGGNNNNNNRNQNGRNFNNNRNNNNQNGRFNQNYNNNNNNNDDFNNNNFNDNSFSNFSNGNGQMNSMNGNGNMNGNNFNGNQNGQQNGNNNGNNGMPGINFAMIAQKMLQAASMGNNNGQNNGNFNGNGQNNGNFNGNGNGMNGFNGNMNGQQNNRRNNNGGGPMRNGGGGGRGGRTGPYNNKQKQAN